MTYRTAYSFHQYAGAFTVTRSAVDWLRPGMDVEFARYSTPSLFIYEVETGDELVVPIAAVTVENLGPQSWRVLRDGRMLVEVRPVPADFRQRDFAPPRGYKLLTRFIRPEAPWPDPPEWMTLDDLVASN